MGVEYNEWLEEIESGIRERIFCNVTWNVENGNMKVEIGVFGTVVAHEVNVADLRELYNKGKHPNGVAWDICNSAKLKWLELIEKKGGAKNAQSWAKSYVF